MMCCQRRRRIEWTLSGLVGVLSLYTACAFSYEVPHRPQTVVLYSVEDPPAVHTACAAETCTAIAVEELQCTRDRVVSTVILGGHSLPPTYLNHTAEEIAAAVACLEPELLILDTCYGFSLPLLEALAGRNLQPILVGTTTKLPPNGLRYGALFSSTRDSWEAATMVEARSGVPVQRWRLDPQELAYVRRTVDQWDRDQLMDHLVHRLPNLVRVDLPTSNEVLIVVPPERFRNDARDRRSAARAGTPL